MFITKNMTQATDPVEKFSPPSETGESKLRKTFALTVSAASCGVSSDGIKWTRRRASYLKLTRMKYSTAMNERTVQLTISGSWYSSNTSRVERKVPLKIVGSSNDYSQHWLKFPPATLTRNNCQLRAKIRQTHLGDVQFV